MDKKEILKKVNSFKSDDAKINYLKRLEPKIGVNSVTSETREAFYEVLGDSYVGEGLESNAKFCYRKAGLTERESLERIGDVIISNKSSNRRYGPQSARFYEEAGLNKSNDPEKLLKLAEAYELSGQEDRARYIQRRIEKLKRKGSDLENKVVSSIFGICALAGIYFGISGMTGAAIGLTKASSSFLGVLLFVGGIAGLFFGRR
ncbi:MAG: hypothetical protein WC812_03710 [Candidatus Pacearchaeota archaeon]